VVNGVLQSRTDVSRVPRADGKLQLNRLITAQVFIAHVRHFPSHPVYLLISIIGMIVYRIFSIRRVVRRTSDTAKHTSGANLTVKLSSMYFTTIDSDFCGAFSPSFTYLLIVPRSICGYFSSCLSPNELNCRAFLLASLIAYISGSYILNLALKLWKRPNLKQTGPIIGITFCCIVIRARLGSTKQPSQLTSTSTEIRMPGTSPRLFWDYRFSTSTVGIKRKFDSAKNLSAGGWVMRGGGTPDAALSYI